VKQLESILKLIKKLENKEIDYFLVTLRHSGAEKKADIFYRFQDEESIKYVNEALNEMENEKIEPSNAPKTTTAAEKAPPSLSKSLRVKKLKK
jgi:hypothetical protein